MYATGRWVECAKIRAGPYACLFFSLCMRIRKTSDRCLGDTLTYLICCKRSFLLSSTVSSSDEKTGNFYIEPNGFVLHCGPKKGSEQGPIKCKLLREPLPKLYLDFFNQL